MSKSYLLNPCRSAPGAGDALGVTRKGANVSTCVSGQISAHRGPQTQPQPLSLNPLTVSPSRASDALAALDFRPMSVEEVELKSWTASRIGELTQTRESDCLEIAECILGFDDPHVLKAGPFTWHLRLRDLKDVSGIQHVHMRVIVTSYNLEVNLFVAMILLV